MSDNEDEERVQKEVSELLKKSYDHPDVVAFTEILLDEFPDIKNDTQLNLALYIKSLDARGLERFLNRLLPRDIASGKKSKKKKKTRKRKPKRRKTRRHRSK